nr:HAMP domain-containing sensor histidine kinase [Paenibacillus sp. MMS18-CY102]
MSFPFYFKDSYAGVFCISSDYTARFKQNSAILQSFGWFSAGLILVVSLFVHVLTNKISRPLAALSHALREFGAGRNAAKAVPAIRREDEIGQLAGSFQQMKDQIEEHMHRIAAEQTKVVALEQSRRRFYQHITHELKTPIATISGYAQIISKRDFNDAVFLGKAAGKIKLESDRLHEMITQALELAQQDEGVREQDAEPLDLAAEIEDCCEDMAIKAARYGMKLELAGSPADWTVFGQRAELRKVWINLLDNGIKYGAVGTAIHIQIQRQGNNAAIQFSNELDDETAVDSQLVFEPFYQHRGTAPSERGSIGLGLAICKSIAEHHGGTITFCQEGRYVKVRVKLPLRPYAGNI